MAIADWLSTWRVVGALMFCFILFSSLRSQTSSFAACAAAMYSASVLDSATALCFFELQLMAAPASKKTYPDVDFRSLTLVAQLASTKPCKISPPAVLHWNTSFQSLVA